MVDSPENLRRQARAIAAHGKGPKEAWTELRSWASGKGPVAMRSAMIEFVSAHGRSPEAALLMPKLMQDQSLSPLERGEVLALARHTPLRQAPVVEITAPRFNAPTDRSISLHPPEARRPFSLPAPDDIRNMHLAIAEKTRITLEHPKPLETARFDASKSPDSFVMNAGMHKGEHLVHSLVEKLRSHARDEHPVRVMSGEPKAAKAKRKTATKRRPPAKRRASKPKPRKNHGTKKTRRK